MTTCPMYRVERVPVPRWLDSIDTATARDVFGEQAEWGFTIPWMHHVLRRPGPIDRCSKHRSRTTDCFLAGSATGVHCSTFSSTASLVTTRPWAALVVRRRETRR